jgi:NitT/TauT family transport system ATP-binding protein
MSAHLEVLGLSKRHAQAQQEKDYLVLDDISFQVEKGSFTSIVGPSGCGKSTLLRILAGLTSQSCGQILLDGNMITTRLGRLGFVFQEHALFPWRSTLRNVEFGLEVAGIPDPKRSEAAKGLLQSFGLSGYEKHYPNELSGGMRQRVAIARALVTNPTLVLMDEPFSAMDCQTRLALQVFLKDVWSRRRDTVLLVTHNVDEAVYLSDCVIVLSSRPSSILEIVPVPIPHPRDRTGDEAIAIRRRILRMLQETNPM